MTERVDFPTMVRFKKRESKMPEWVLFDKHHENRHEKLRAIENDGTVEWLEIYEANTCVLVRTIRKVTVVADPGTVYEATPLHEAP